MADEARKLRIRKADNSGWYILGAQGSQGYQGHQGHQGDRGYQGVQGMQGVQGIGGNQGAQGLTGAQGSQGAQGSVGAQGNDGATGATGSQGAQGVAGAQGNTGAQGSFGAQGFQGVAGATGPQGAQGMTGAQGNTGAQGSFGAQGFQGVAGATGPQGAQGATGAQGGVGAQGSTGAQGAGFTATSGTSLLIGTGSKSLTTQAGLSYAIGARVRIANSADVSKWMEGIVTSYAGTTLIVDVDLTGGSGTYASWNIFAGGVQGAQGNQGATGAQGAAGAQGSQGVTGTTGAQGPTGPQGFQGATGAQGITGAVGSQGATGAAGAQGSEGPQGFQGATGAQGATGLQGSQGATGATGAQGSVGAQGNQGATGAQGITGAAGSQGYQGAQGVLGDALASAVTIQSGGYFKIGTGTKDSTLDGIQIDHAELVGQAGGVDQVVIGADGKLKAGVGAVTLDQNGISLTEGTLVANNLKWQTSGGLSIAEHWSRKSGGTTSHQILVKGDTDISSLELAAERFGIGPLTAALYLYTPVSGTSYVNVLGMELRRNGVAGTIFVPLTTPLTSTSWDGDARSTTAKTLIDLSAVFGVPAGVKAILADVAVRDSGSAAGNSAIILGPTNTANVGLITSCWGVANDAYVHTQPVVPCDADGDIYYQTIATGSGTLDVDISIWGYWI